MSRKTGIAVTIGALLTATLMAVPRDAGAAEDAHGLRLLQTRTSLLGTHTWYQQTYNGIDVLDGVVAQHDYSEGDAVRSDKRRLVGGTPATKAKVTSSTAKKKAGAGAGSASLTILPAADSRLVWSVIVRVAGGVERVLVDATTGAVVSRRRIEQRVDGGGTVFDPNPVVTLQDRTLTDQDDANAPEFGPAYHAVVLRHLDGSGFLRGTAADVLPTDGVRARSPDHDFNHDRSSLFFSQTMAYYHLTRAQDYIQALGFSAINNEPQAVIADAFADDISFYSPATDSIELGSGGVDDAEDADIIWHEYGHAIHADQVPGFGLSHDARSIGEGFGDYWAVTMSQPVNGGFDEPCVGDWDFAALSPGTCLRRIDLDLTVDDRVGQVHFDGQIWSRALWDINQALGRDVANIIVLESQFAFEPDTSFTDAAHVTVDTATRLFGSTAARAVQDAFAARGILTTGRPERLHPVPARGPGLHEVARLFTEAPGGTFYVDGFEPYELNDGGRVMFASDIAGGGQGVFDGPIGGLQATALSGAAAPGGGTYGLGVAAGPAMNATGEVAFTYILEPFTRPFGANTGLYRTRGGETTAIVVPGVTAAPGGGVFIGTSESPSINAAGTIAFAGMIETDFGVAGDLGMGVYLAPSGRAITPVVVPGDPAPGGSHFDFATEPAINDRGDIAFTGHIAGRPCDQLSQAGSLGCSRDLFFRSATSGVITRIAGRGDPAPGGGVFRSLQYPEVNSAGDIVFRANVVTSSGLRRGIYVVRDRVVEAVARFGQEMPGGGRFVNGGVQPGNWDINDRGDVTFSAALDTDDDFNELADEGLYRYSDGALSLVVRSGEMLEDGNIVIALQPLWLLGRSPFPFSGAAVNNWRQVLFQVTVYNPDEFFFGTVLYVTR